MLLLYWLCTLLVLYTYLGYGLTVRLLVARKRRRAGTPRKAPVVTDWPEVTLMICAYNEQAVVDEKMQNCRQLDYPEGRLHIVWVTDGSTDRTNELLARYPDAQVLYEVPRRGKTAALNRAVPLVKTPIVVFTDANTQLNPESIREIVTCFADPTVGCVAGEKRILVETSDGLAARGEGLYWKYESTLKRWDSELCSTMGAAGELFAIRRELFEPMDVNMLLDDFIMSMRIVDRGYRIAYCPTAYACEKGSATLQDEQTRKVRIAAGGLQSIWQLRSMLNPYARPMGQGSTPLAHNRMRRLMIAFQLVGHRFLRWTITPVALFALVPINVCLVWMDAGWFYYLTWVLQLIFYALAVVGMRIPSYFLFMNLSALRAVPYLIKKRPGTGAWEKAR